MRRKSRKNGRLRWLIIALPLAILLTSGIMFAIVADSNAHRIVVNTFDNEDNHDGDCSLREAVRAANLDVPVDACPEGNGADEVYIPAGIYCVSSQAPLTIVSDLAIVGVGSMESIIQFDGPTGAGIGSLFDVGDADFNVSGVTIYAGGAPSNTGRLN